MIVAATTCAGACKAQNQDAYCAMTAQTPAGEVGLLAVCDGVGGLALGELASSVAVNELAGWFERDLPQLLGQGAGAAATASAPATTPGSTPDLGAALSSLSALLKRINDALLAYGDAHDAGLGTTVTAVLTCGLAYAIAHVGDCRAYRIRRDTIQQLTQDQTLVQRYVDAGRISEKEALAHPQRSVILQAVGSQRDLVPRLSQGSLEEGDLLVVCCDGFYRLLGNDGVLAGLAPAAAGSEKCLEDALRRMAGKVMDAGEKDNITAVCALMGEGAGEADAPTTVLAGAEAADDDATAVLGTDTVPAADDAPTSVLLAAADEPTDDEATSPLAGGE